MDSISFVNNADESQLRLRLSAPALNTEQDLYVSTDLPTGRVMVKDEDVCLHCGLCAERCPTNAWDMQRSIVHVATTGVFCRMSVSYNDFVIRLCECQRFRVPQAQTACLPKALFRMGIPVATRNIFPSNIQGLPLGLRSASVKKGIWGAAKA